MSELDDLFVITYKVDFYLFISLLRLLYKIARRKFLLQIYLGRIVFMIYRQEYIILIQKIIENLLIDPVVHLVVQYGYIITQAVMKG